MTLHEACLRSQVEKWLGAELTTCVRVTHFSHTRRKPWRYVCVQATRPSGTFTFVFFRHDDGSWRVFPPQAPRPAMRVSEVDKGMVAIPDDALAI